MLPIDSSSAFGVGWSPYVFLLQGLLSSFLYQETRTGGETPVATGVSINHPLGSKQHPLGLLVQTTSPRVDRRDLSRTDGHRQLLGCRGDPQGMALSSGMDIYSQASLVFIRHMGFNHFQPT